MAKTKRVSAEVGVVFARFFDRCKANWRGVTFDVEAWQCSRAATNRIYAGGVRCAEARSAVVRLQTAPTLAVSVDAEVRLCSRAVTNRIYAGDASAV